MKIKKIECPCKYSIKDLLFFDKLIMPSILTLIYWVVLFFVVLSGLFTMFTGGVAGFFGGIIGMLIGIVSTRISFELICVVFSINRNLEKLVELQSGSKADVTTPEDVGAESKAEAEIHISHDKED